MKEADIQAYLKELYEFEKAIFEKIILEEQKEEKNNKIEEAEERYSKESSTKNVHDTSFRNVLANKREAYLFINNTLKLKNTENEIAMEQLEQCDNRYITKTYYNKETDILYKIKNRQVYFLIEHQSSVDYEMPKRIMEYVIEILRKNVEDREVKNKRYKLPLIIPIVLYTGNKKWNVKDYIVEIQEEISGYKNREFGKYILVDANKYKEKELIEKEGVLSKIILLERTKDIEKTYEKIKYENLEEYEKELIDEYTCNVASRILPEIKIEEIREKVRRKEGGESMLADALLKMKEKYIVEGKRNGIIEGKKAGIQEGKKVARREEKLKIAKSLKLMGLKVEDIVKATGLSKNEIEKL